jgi:hypothetical protein
LFLRALGLMLIRSKKGGELSFFRDHVVGIAISGIVLSLISSWVFERYLREPLLQPSGYAADINRNLEGCNWVPPDATRVVIIPTQPGKAFSTNRFSFTGALSGIGGIIPHMQLLEGLRNETLRAYDGDYVVYIFDSVKGSLIRSFRGNGIGIFFLRIDEIPDFTSLSLLFHDRTRINSTPILRDAGRFEFGRQRCTLLNIIVNAKP